MAFSLPQQLLFCFVFAWFCLLLRCEECIFFGVLVLFVTGFLVGSSWCACGLLVGFCRMGFVGVSLLGRGCWVRGVGSSLVGWVNIPRFNGLVGLT